MASLIRVAFQNQISRMHYLFFLARHEISLAATTLSVSFLATKRDEGLDDTSVFLSAALLLLLVMTRRGAR